MTETGREPVPFPRDRFVGEPGYDIFTNEQTMIGYTLDHRVNDTWSLRQSARYTNVDTNTRRVQIGAMVSETQAIRYAWAFPETSHAFQIDNQVNAKFTAGPTSHDLTMGLDYLREKSRYNESSLGLMMPPAYPLFDVFDPVYGASVTRPPTATKINMTRSQIGVYAQTSNTRLHRGQTSVGWFAYRFMPRVICVPAPGSSVTSTNVAFASLPSVLAFLSLASLDTAGARSILRGCSPAISMLTRSILAASRASTEVFAQSLTPSGWASSWSGCRSVPAPPAIRPTPSRKRSYGCCDRSLTSPPATHPTTSTR